MENCILSATFSDQVGGLASHFHDCHQLLFIRTGTARVTVSGKCYEAGPGTLVLISRFETHSISVLSQEYSRYTLQISPQAINRSAAEVGQLLSLLVNRPQSFHHAVHVSETERVERIFRQLVEEHGSGKPLESEMGGLLLLEVLIHAVRADPALLSRQEQNFQLIRQVQILFETDFRSCTGLEQLAKHFHVSPSYLSHQFKAVTGRSVMGYLQSCRLAAAKELLVHTDLEIAQVVEASGFSDSSNFSRTFKAETGFTPSQFRKHFKASGPASV